MMTELSIDAYVVRAGLAMYPLLYEDAPFPESKLKADKFGPFAEAVEALRQHHAARLEQTAQTGQLYDVYAEARMIWEGLRSNDDGAKRYGLIDDELKKLAWGLEKDVASQVVQQTKPKPKAKPPTEYIPAPEQTESTTLIDRLTALGFTFRLNLCSDSIEVNGRKITDITAAEIRVALRDAGLTKKLQAAEDAYMAEAKRNAYHPIREYLNNLTWNGDDHISRLTADYMASSDPPVKYDDGTVLPLHAVYLYRWLIGAVAKVMNAEQNVMLVLDGKTDLGKSTFARWLCSGMPDYFIEAPIKVEDKDTDVHLIDRWIWEVSELDATTRKADQSALKAFITKKEVTVRKAYGRHSITKPAMAALIGTLNNSTGFLTDDTGNRRFLVTCLTKLDFHYDTIDVGQLWAQAVQMYRDGEPWKLIAEERISRDQNNLRYEVETTLSDWIDRYFMFDPESTDKPLSLADILTVMERDYKPNGSDRSQAMELARVLIAKGARKVETRKGKRWVGLYAIPR